MLDAGIKDYFGSIDHAKLLRLVAKRISDRRVLKLMRQEAERRVREILAQLGLELHPEKTRRVELSWGKQGFDFLGCHLHERMSGPIWERERRRVHFLHRWPSARSMKRINPVLRGWGVYFRTGNAAHNSSTRTGSSGCAEPSSTRRRHDAVSREITGEPCAGKPHAGQQRIEIYQ